MAAASPPSTILNSQFTEAKWMLQTEENLKLDLEKVTQSLLCVVRIPGSLKQAQQRPPGADECYCSYTPQLIGLGPFHHFRSDLYQMEPIKLAIAKRGLARFGLSSLRDLADLLSPLLPSIQACYGLHLDLQDDTLARVVAIDGLFLIEFLHNEELVILSSVAPCFSKRKLSPHAVLRDLVLLENQVPLFLLGEALRRGGGASSAAISEQICSKLDSVCRFLSPLDLPTQFPPYVRRRHLLDRLYLLMTCRNNNNNTTHSAGLVDLLRAPTSLGILQRVAVGLHLKLPADPPPPLLPLVRASSDPTAAAALKGDDGEGTVTTDRAGDVGDVDDDTQRMAALLQKTTSLPAPAGHGNNAEHNRVNRAKSLFSKMESSIKIDETVTNQLQSFAQQNDKLPITGVFRVFTMLDQVLKEDKRLVPSVYKLKRVGVKVLRARDIGLNNIRFDHHAKTLELPAFTWSPNTEVVMRNLLAYEAHAKSSSLLLKRYMELMHGLVRSVEDVQLLMEEGVVSVGAGDPTAVLEMFTAMGTGTNYPKDPTILDQTVGRVREFYSNKWKTLVKRLSKKYAKVTIQALVIFTGLALIIVLFIQAWCSVYKCSGSALHQTLAEILQAHHLLSYSS
ncbi:unnamed protein product [Linum trigynum]|uniref:Uncharacterized protein n=1 Tax=Linum trigynum TaxID=586398 RepID=A0AAV2FMT5_9ROSI